MVSFLQVARLEASLTSILELLFLPSVIIEYVQETRCVACDISHASKTNYAEHVKYNKLFLSYIASNLQPRAMECYCKQICSVIHCSLYVHHVLSYLCATVVNTTKPTTESQDKRGIIHWKPTAT